MIKTGDEVIKRNPERFVHNTGKVLKVIPGGYEVQLHGSKQITYENDETIELRFPDE
jgi:hypothetical protein